MSNSSDFFGVAEVTLASLGYTGDIDATNQQTKSEIDNLRIDSDTIDGIDSTELELKIEKGVSNGYAPLDAAAKVPIIHMPDNVTSLGSGWDDYVSSAPLAHAGNKVDKKSSIDGHMVDIWQVGDGYSYNHHIQHNYEAQTLLYPHVHWTAVDPAVVITETVQFDISVSFGIPELNIPFSTPVTVSILTSPQGYNYPEVSEVTQVQAVAILAPLTVDITPDTIVRVDVVRASPVSGVPLVTDMSIGHVDLHFLSDGKLTVEKVRPFTKIG